MSQMRHFLGSAVYVDFGEQAHSDVPVSIVQDNIETFVRRDDKLWQLVAQRRRERLGVKHFIANGMMALHCALKLLRLKGEVVYAV